MYKDLYNEAFKIDGEMKTTQRKKNDVNSSEVTKTITQIEQDMN